MSEVFVKCAQVHQRHEELFKEKASSYDDRGRYLSSFSPDEQHQARVNNWNHLEEMFESSQDKSGEMLYNVDPGIRRVLDAAGDLGPQPEFLRQALSEAGYRQADMLVKDTLSGFGVVGPIQTDPDLHVKLIQRQSINKDELPSGTDEWNKVIATHLAAVQRASPEVNEEIWQQTVEDQRLGRISDFEEPNHRLPVPTRRFGVTQSSSKGVDKVR